MKSEFDSSQHMLVLAAALISHGIFAAENAPTTRCLLPAPPASAGSVAEPPTATDTGAPQAASAVRAADLPPVSPGVTELKFSEFFRQPVGPRGLEFTEKARGLDGKRVRICGYMVRQSQPVERCLLLTPVTLTLHEDEYGFAEDMPATVLHVFVDRSEQATVAFTPGLLLLTGTLSIGNRTETDGRISCLRLQLDAPAPEQRKALKGSGEDSNNTERKTDPPAKVGAPTGSKS